MTLRMFPGIAACCGAAVALICGTPQPARSTHEHTPERQNIDVLSAVLTPQSPPAAQPSGPQLQSEVQSQPQLIELDAASTPFALKLAQVSALERGERIRLTLPDDRVIVLTPVAVDARDGTWITTAVADHLVSTITRRGRHFYATVASPTASYRVTGEGIHATAVDQRTLALRTAYIEQDYHYVR